MSDDRRQDSGAAATKSSCWARCCSFSATGQPPLYRPARSLTLATGLPCSAALVTTFILLSGSHFCLTSTARAAIYRESAENTCRLGNSWKVCVMCWIRWCGGRTERGCTGWRNVGTTRRRAAPSRAAAGHSRIDRQGPAHSAQSTGTV